VTLEYGRAVMTIPSNQVIEPLLDMHLSMTFAVRGDGRIAHIDEVPNGKEWGAVASVVLVFRYPLTVR